jgi:hypothetical protein
MKGARVANLPLARDGVHRHRETVVGVEIAQIYTRYIVPARRSVTFKVFPGQVFKGKVDTVLEGRRRSDPRFGHCGDAEG